MTSFSSVQYTYCISSASERKETWNCMHFLVILSLNSLWAGVKHWRTALHRFYVYRKPISSPRSRNIQKYISPPLPLPEEEGAYIFGMKQVPVSRNLKVIKKMCTFEVHLCMISHSGLILSGKPFNTFSMVRLNILQLRLTLTPLFTATHAFFFSLTIFFPWSVIGVFFFILVTLDLCLLLIHRDLWNSQKWQILISVNRDLDFFYFLWLVTRTPTLLKFSSMEKVFKIHVDLNLQTFFSSIFICILGGLCLSCLPLNCHYHQIGFALTQVVPVSYYFF